MGKTTWESKHKQSYNNKMDLRGIMYDYVCCIQLVQDRIQ
jgi:hypothetical protein